VSSNEHKSFTSKEQDRIGNLPDEPQKSPFRLGVLISGTGSNLQALIDAIENQQLPGIEIALVVSNKADAYGLQRALKHRIPAIYLPWERRVGARFTAPVVGAKFIAPSMEAQLTAPESLLAALLHLFQVDLVVLAGWMRILSATFLAQFPRRIINIHPALLPDAGTGSTYFTSDGAQIPVFRGLRAVQQALDAGVKITGSCVHYVTPEVDAGPVICRQEVAIEEEDTEETLHERLKVVEHRLIVEAVRRCSSKL
jgi:phosphoribosylglycinamide formyltransferase-1